MEGSSNVTQDLKLTDAQKKGMATLDRLVSDVGASQMTLEEVILKVT